MVPMNVYDLALLRAAGFVAGFSGQSWFGKDRSGMEWHAYVDERTSFIMFRKYEDERWGPYAPMQLEEFERVFKTGE